MAGKLILKLKYTSMLRLKLTKIAYFLKILILLNL